MTGYQDASAELARHQDRGERLRVEGLVQGVGFRPFVWWLAQEQGLGGRVWNDAQGVVIELWGPAAERERFRHRLHREAPPLARIDVLHADDLAVPLEGPPEGFAIVDSGAGPARTGIAADAPVCPQCLAELFDPAARRYRYPFLNCTHCGPRFTITAAIPYDRPHTALAGFPLCSDCATEYEDPADRRFHAQAIACPRCGPELVFRWADEAGRAEGALPEALNALEQGKIVAIKGIGGYHLAVDAANPQAVERLRQRKERSGKPFALMAANPASLEGVAAVGAAARDQLESRARPVVLLPQKGNGSALPANIAPGLAEVGVMLPYAPVHYLLFHEAAGRPEGTAWLEQPQDLLLVMTSANAGGEPLVTGNAEAARRLAGLADAFLEHDRPILVGCDDSVVRPPPLGPGSFLRRSRGYVPEPIRLPEVGASVVATGGWLKSTVCLTRGDRAYPSQHVGDLANPATIRFMEGCASHLEQVLEIEPEAVACDWHPDFPSTRFANELAEQKNLPVVPVQHHHAHIASVAAEHGITGPVLGIALDGVGLGPDGQIWGGELLRVDGARMAHLAGLRPLLLPGGDRAAREPWRVAAGVLSELGRWSEAAARFPDRPVDPIGQLLKRGVNCPATSSAGRLFDAAAALLNIRHVTGFEGQAAMELEAAARRWGPEDPLPDGWAIREGQLDWRPLMAHLADGPHSDQGAARFHATLAAAIVDWAGTVAFEQGLDRALLGGGCWINGLLEQEVRNGLNKAGLDVYAPQAVPPGDGGLSLGQAWVAIQSLKE